MLVVGTRFGTEKNLERCGYPTVKKYDDTFSRFDTIPACDRQTDGQTDRQSSDAYRALRDNAVSCTRPIDSCTGQRPMAGGVSDFNSIITFLPHSACIHDMA